MEFVVAEVRRPFKWYHDNGVYHQIHGDKIIQTIIGNLIPDPDELTARRKATQRFLPKDKRGAYRTQPDPVTIALYNDYRSRQESQSVG